MTCWSCGTTDLMLDRDVCIACYRELHDLRPEDASEEEDA